MISPRSGYISSIDAMAIGLIAVCLGAGRKSVEESIDFAAGIVFQKKTGMFVEKGDVLANIYTERDDVLGISVHEVLEAISFSDENVNVPPLITHIVKIDGIVEFDQSTLADLDN